MVFRFVGTGLFYQGNGLFGSRFNAWRFQGTIVAQMSPFGRVEAMQNRHGPMTVFCRFDCSHDKQKAAHLGGPFFEAIRFDGLLGLPFGTIIKIDGCVFCA